MDEIKPQKNDKKFSMLLIVILVVIIVLAAVLFAFSNNIFLDDKNVKSYTKTYINVTAKEAYEIINTTKNLTVIDCRGLDKGVTCSQCTFNKGHLPGAIISIVPSTLFNTTNNTLVYSSNGSESKEFCSELENKVYGKIYNLVGGYVEWEAAGYPKK